MSDPHYGYGHGAVLRCDQHAPTNPCYDSHHPYDPDSDDFFLGFAKVHLDWCALGTTKKPICYDCQKEIPPDESTEHSDPENLGGPKVIRYGYNKIGHGIRVQHVDVEENGRLEKRSQFKETLYYCREHFIERHRLGKQDVDVIEK
jgi:hypothetical protein